MLKTVTNLRLLQTYDIILKRSMHLLKDKAYVNGAWIPAKSGATFEVRNPANGAVVAKVPDMVVSDTEEAISAAWDAFQTFQQTTNKDRAELLRKWYLLLEKNRDEIAKIMIMESGKPVCEAQGEVTYGNSFVEWYSQEARRIRGEVIPSAVNSKKLFVDRYPIGVAAIITPWNFPLAMITRKVGAAIASGCTCVIKPAEDTPLTALAAAALAEEAGFPKGVINVIVSNRRNTPEIGLTLCESPKVAGVFFTGSTAVGKILYKQCASGVKRIGLELGGNAPFIVYKSADIDNAVKSAMVSKFRNCGQACVSSNRFLVQEEVFDEFVDKVVKATRELKLGDVNSPDVKIGPLINEAQFTKVHNMVQDAVTKGAKVLTGAKPATEHGPLYYEPTVLTNIKDNMQLYTEEIFGPVLSIIKFKTEEESLKIANGVRTGLAGYFFSSDVSQIFRVSKALEVGMLGINEGLISTCEAPFGGVKESGIGREGSHHGIEDYTYYKYICLGNLSYEDLGRN